MSTGQWITSPDGARWFFDSGSLALDLGYTGDYGYGVPEWERLRSAADLGAWLTARLGPLVGEPSGADLAAALRLRAAISGIALALAAGAQPEPTDIDVVNEAALVPPPAPHLDGGTTQAGRADALAALSTVARDAVVTFGAGRARIRRCAGEDCELVFFDTSRPGARRWCSMRRCGNRSKVRAHRSRVHGGAP